MIDNNKPAAGSVKTFACPSCGGTITIRAVGITVSAVCQSCGSVIDVANDNLEIIRKAAVKVHRSAIPLGARGTLMGAVWEVIGYTEKTDGSQKYWWREYLLFNPYQGFRFLVEADGHWSFVKMLREDVDGTNGKGKAERVVLNGQSYKMFTRGNAIVQYVMGEFYWRVRVSEQSYVTDYVAPPYMLSREQSAEDVIWSLGTYIESEEVQKAFALADNVLPLQDGIAPNQPSPGTKGFMQLMQMSAGFFALLVVMQVMFASGARNEIIYERAVRAESVYKGQVIIADPIEVPEDRGNLRVMSYSPVVNNWVELDISLVNEATQESEDFIQAIEYYTGYDSDGAWSEGSQTTHGIISNVRGGKYKLLVEPDAGVFKQQYKFLVQPDSKIIPSTDTVDFGIRITRNVPMWNNFWLALTLLLIYPFCLIIRRWHFETQRWADSDYAPAIYRKSE